MEPETTPTDQQQQQPSAPTTPANDLRSVSAEEYQQLLADRSALTQLRNTQAAERDRAERARLDALAEAGQAKDALTQLEASWKKKHGDVVRQHDELQASILGEKLTSTLLGAFAGREFVGETADDKAAAQGDLARLLESQFEAVRGADGRIQVRDKATGREAAAVLKESLDGRRYAHYFASKGQGANSKPAGGSTAGQGGATVRSPQQVKAYGVGLSRAR
jgi:hypothetical protein